MMRLLLLVAAAAGAAWWWWRRQSAPAADELPASPSVLDEPPQLGGEVDADLLAILACPLDKQPVSREGNYLVCAQCKRHYPIREGIPVMLVDEALTPEQAAATPQ
jgi:uncharacterized protein YbaR (Trm112 family)